jgi:hypothetical protein
MINDDLQALSRIPLAMGAEAAQIENDVVYTLLTSNPVMSDTIALFATGHANLAGTGTAINTASLSAARAAMRKQQAPLSAADALAKPRYLSVVPKYLLVGPDKEAEANQFTSSQFVANQPASINPDYNRSLTPIVEPRLTGNQWYLVGDYAMVDTFEYAYLEGESGLFTERRIGFEVDGVEIKARSVFGAKPIDWRNMYKNPGA